MEFEFRGELQLDFCLIDNQEKMRVCIKRFVSKSKFEIMDYSIDVILV